MVSYATDGAGVGPHFDRYDVFLLQGFEESGAWGHTATTTRHSCRKTSSASFHLSNPRIRSSLNPAMYSMSRRGLRTGASRVDPA